MVEVMPAASGPGAARPAGPRGLSALTVAARALTLAALALALSVVAFLGLAAPAAAVVPDAPARPVATPAPAPAPGQPTAPAADLPGAPVVPGATPSGTPGDLLRELTEPAAPGQKRSLTSNPVGLVVLLGVISLVPAVLIMVTAFTRIVIVLGFTRSALGTQGVPPNQVLIGLALFLTYNVMAPVFGDAKEKGIDPYLAGTISQTQAYEATLEPFRDWMFEQVRDEDLALFTQLAKQPRPANEDEVATTTLIPAFVIGELRAAFLIGFVIFIPFIIIDLVVSAVLSALGMVMLPPALISLPFKLLLFVAADGWYLLARSLVTSFNTV